MARVTLSLCFIALFLGFIMYSSYVEAIPKAWCVARRDAPTSKLQEVLDYLCGKYDCREILPGGQCFPPDTVYDHASYAIDLNFRTTTECDLEYSIPTFADPSYGTCVYP